MSVLSTMRGPRNEFGENRQKCASRQTAACLARIESRPLGGTIFGHPISWIGSTRMERTLVILKPDSVQRRLVGRILARFEDKGLRIVGMKMLRMERSLAERFYAVHQGRDFYEPLLAFM